ncbi:MAG: type IV pilin protein [Actinomycetota bacterium]
MRDVQLRTRRTEEGFTLIELMMVVLIIAILLTILIPTFLGARERANDTSAKADLRIALTAAQVHYSETEDYRLLTAPIMDSIEPRLVYDADVANADESTVGFTDAGANSLVLVRKAKNGDFFCLGAGDNGPTFGRADVLATVDTLAECDGGWDG